MQIGLIDSFGTSHQMWSSNCLKSNSFIEGPQNVQVVSYNSYQFFYQLANHIWYVINLSKSVAFC